MVDELGGLEDAIEAAGEAGGPAGAAQASSTRGGGSRSCDLLRNELGGCGPVSPLLPALADRSETPLYLMH